MYKFCFCFFLMFSLFLGIVSSLLLFQMYHQLVYGWNEMSDWKQLWAQIILFFFSTSKYCCAAMLTGWRSALETEPTGDSRAEALSSSAVAVDQGVTTIITSHIRYSQIFFLWLQCTHHFLFHLIYFFPAHSASGTKDENREDETIFWEFLGLTGRSDGKHHTNLGNIIPDPAALGLCHRAEEGEGQRNASAELTLCVSVT